MYRSKVFPPSTYTDGHLSQSLISPRSMGAQSGFTLMEVLVVMAIIGILASMAVPAYQRYTAQARITSAMGSLRSQQLDVEQFLLGGEPFARYTIDTPAGVYGDLSVSLDQQQPVLHYRFKAAVAAALGEKGQAILHLLRHPTGGWQCRAEGIRPRLLPAECQA